MLNVLPRLRSLLTCLCLSSSLIAAAGCDRPRGTDAPHAEALAALVAEGWIDAPPIGEATRDDPERLAILAQGDAEARILRLDRLLDLYDGARFADDREARDSLWLALGGSSTTRGIDASREVVLRLLDEAYALEDLAIAAEQDPAVEDLSDEQRRFISDAIMLLSTDMFLPDSAESLITQTLAYRVLTDQGHPRIADNAHWRVYDHVRGVLEGAVEIGPELRPDVLIHALYAEREDLSAWLEDLAPHAQPPLPGPRELWALLERHREALAELPRWQGVLAARAEAEANLRQTVLALLPRPRDPGWALPELARGSGLRESLAPVVLLRPGAIVLEPTAVEPRPVADADELRTGAEGLLARDGRGILLLAADPKLPAPEYAAALEALAGARANRLELAVHEPRIGEAAEDPEAGDVVVALPLYVARADDLAPGARALREARIHVQLTGRGPRFRVDGRWLSAAPVLPTDIAGLAAKLHDAYPRERALSLSLGPDVQHRQLVDLLAAVSGGVDPAFLAVGWLPEAEIVRDIEADAKADETVELRLASSRTKLSVVPEGPEAVSADELSRVGTAAKAVFACIPELEAELPRKGLELRLSFDDGRIKSLTMAAPRRLARSRKQQIAAVEDCAKQRLLGFRLDEIRDPVELSLTFVAESP